MITNDCKLSVEDIADAIFGGAADARESALDYAMPESVDELVAQRAWFLHDQGWETDHYRIEALAALWAKSYFGEAIALHARFSR